ncbi:T9SS type A sorting domain-containing protein [Tamlana sp. 2_MG-2023]|uniref:T9SS type A sorting domain-containing protein n=1 Tax=unclassified Tamlana TaxID=2614803 RepID=UPI0026E2CFEB|nr:MULTISPECIES: T9SS type A sorting domain-containing protein [unclassified Tamlana]MDO6760553.1 T9SS type A sorting domain-containing protein [Tamlana sp. 2_MG-2023]MDO6790809.1 T9SS type A sorting domain-containing protein [Tamlana sp. 1_MG-2023]
MGALNITLNKIGLLFLVFFLSGTTVFSQIFLKEIPLEQQIAASKLVVEGKVIAKQAFFGADDNIYTKNIIEVYKVFKGAVVSSVDVITTGGTVGLDCQMVTHSLKLNVGDLGVFTLVESAVSGLNSNNNYVVYSGVQGYYKYNLYADAVVNAFTAKQGISNSFYKALARYTKANFKKVKVFSAASETSKLNEAKSSLIPSGISFAPNTITAGTRSTIKITSSTGASGNFGSSKGKVSFRDADTGGEDDGGKAVFIDALDSQIISWSTNSITVEVPSEAGTGNIRVTDANSNIIESANSLTVVYALQNVVFNVDAGSGNKDYAFPTRLVNNDGSGGYRFRLETSFNADNVHPGAKDNFFTALETWRCETGVNLSIGPVSSVDSANPTDGVNIVRFDNGDELPDGTLARTTYRFKLCPSNSDVLNNSVVFPTDIDMVFDDEASWYFGTGSPGFAVDFQGVALHEIGHAHQLAHVIKEFNDVMHYSTSIGQQIRDLSDDNKLAGGVIQSKSVQSLPVESCYSGKSALIPVRQSGCTLSTSAHIAEHQTLKLYPNPTNGLLSIQGAAAAELEQMYIFDVSGRCVFDKMIENPSSTEVVDLTTFKKGVYFVRILAKEGTLTEKVIVD